MTTTEEIIAAVKSLPEAVQLQVVDKLLEIVYSSEDEIDEAWVRVIERRGREIERGEVELIPADQVLDEARALLQAK